MSNSHRLHLRPPRRPGREQPGAVLLTAALTVLALAVIALAGVAAASASPSLSDAPTTAVLDDTVTAPGAVTVDSGTAAAALTAARALADGDPGVAIVPDDVVSALGYSPGRALGLAANGDGDCSSPVSLPAELEPACRVHDLGYDLLRVAGARGSAIPPGVRGDLDALLAPQTHAACGASPYCPATALPSWSGSRGDPGAGPDIASVDLPRGGRPRALRRPVVVTRFRALGPGTTAGPDRAVAVGSSPCLRRPPRAERGAGGRAHRGRAHRRRRLRPRHPCRGAAHGLRVGGSRAGAGNGTLGRRRRRDDLAALLSRPVRRRVSPASDAGDGVRAGADRRGVGPTRRDGSVRPAVPGGPRREPRRPRRPAG